MISRFERFSAAIFDISKYWHKIAADEMEKYGLKGPHALYLITMHRYNDGVTATQLCELCSKDKSDVSRSIAAMEEKGLVLRETVNGNAYRAKLKLTPMGKKAAEQVGKRAQTAAELGGDGISDQQRSELYEMLERIAKNLRNISEEGFPQKNTNKIGR